MEALEPRIATRGGKNARIAAWRCVQGMENLELVYTHTSLGRRCLAEWFQITCPCVGVSRNASGLEKLGTVFRSLLQLEY